MNSISINGKMFKSIETIVVKSSKVFVDGKEFDHGKVENGILEVKVTGVLENLGADCSVTCDGVRGDVKAGGSVNCDNVGGTVQCGGSVTCDDIAGSVIAGGSVHNG